MTGPAEALAPMDVAGRVERLRASLADAGCDALLVTDLVHVRYLTGFTGSAALVLVGPDDLLFVTDGRYGEQASAQLARAGVVARVEVSGTGQREVVSAGARGAPRVGLEAESVTWAAQRRYAADWFPDAEVVPTSGLVEALRLVKDAGEVDRIRSAAAIADAALAATVPDLLTGPTEAEVALALDTAMRGRGADGPSFPTIVASGPNSAMPHHQPGDRRLHAGDLVVIDFGALVDGYHSDMTRTFCLGEPTADQGRMLQVVAASQAAGVRAVAAGVAARAVDAACRAVIDAAGWGDAFVHGTGHGVGLRIHEDPRVGSTSTATLAAGHIVTVEPGVYLPGHGGVRIEDTVAVTADGCEVLTHAPKASVLT